MSIIQLMHSFDVNIRICQAENSDVHRGEAEVNIDHFRGLTNPDVNKKECTNSFVIRLSFFFFFIKSFHIL